MLRAVAGCLTMAGAHEAVPVAVPGPPIGTDTLASGTVTGGVVAGGTAAGGAVTGGAVTGGPCPEAVGGFTIVEVPSREEALAWGVKLAMACRCAQEVRAFGPDPELDQMLRQADR